MKKDLSIYIHIPFCKTICMYCAFVTFAHKNKKIPDYVEAAISELTEKAATYGNRVIKSIYFGGGTPGLIDPDYIERMLKTIHTLFKVEPDAEVSIECNPENISTERVSKYGQMGITRISLGVQSLKKETLFRIARPHDEQTIFKALDALRETGFKNFGTDLIMGLPYQTLESFSSEIDTLLSYKPTHISLYFLSYDTPKIDHFIKDCPDEETQLQMYDVATEKLRKAGFLHYEVSNFAKPGHESVHNMRYWNQKEYIGIGVGAHSYADRTVWENTENFEEYLNEPGKQKHSFPMTDELRRMDSIMLHLRTAQGIKRTDFENQFADYDDLKEKAGPYIKTGQLNCDADGIRATEKGFLILDRITRDLL